MLKLLVAIVLGYYLWRLFRRRPVSTQSSGQERVTAMQQCARCKTFYAEGSRPACDRGECELKKE